jgi:hypothetical protein
MVMVMLDLKEQLEQHIAYFQHGTERQQGFYVQGGRRDGDILKEKGIRAYFDICIDIARHRREVDSGLGV